MASRVYVEVCGAQYGKGSFSRKWSQIVDSREVGVKVTGNDEKFLRDVCGRFDRFKKIMEKGGVEFKVVNKRFNQKRVKGIVLVTPNSKYEVWVGKAQIVSKLFPKSALEDESKLNRKRALQALRSIISPQIDQFRQSNRERLRGGYYHIDHVYPFKLLVQEWCRDNSLDLETIPVKCRGASCSLESVDMAESWFDYHLLNAKLQILEASENRRKGAKYFGGG